MNNKEQIVPIQIRKLAIAAISKDIKQQEAIAKVANILHAASSFWCS